MRPPSASHPGPHSRRPGGVASAGYGPRHQAAAWFVSKLADAAEAARADALMRGSGDALEALAGAGLVLRLNTAEEAESVARGARLATEAAEAEAREARQAKHREKNGDLARAWQDTVKPKVDA